MKNVSNINIKNLALALLIALSSTVFLSGVLSFQSAGAQNIKQNLCKGADDLTLGQAAPGQNECGDAQGPGSAQRNLNNLIEDIINIFSIVVGIIAVIMIIYGGFKFITSGGDSGRVTSAKQTIIYAIIGLIIVALAQFIVKFILSKTPTT